MSVNNNKLIIITSFDSATFGINISDYPCIAIKENVFILKRCFLIGGLGNLTKNINKYIYSALRLLALRGLWTLFVSTLGPSALGWGKSHSLTVETTFLRQFLFTFSRKQHQIFFTCS